MAAVIEYADTGFSRSSSFSASRSPDTASPIYPERAIRPLPKSRLKSKLSPEQVSTLVFPPEPPPISPTPNFSVAEVGAPVQQTRLANGDSQDHHHYHVVHDHCTCGEEGDSGDDEVEFDHPDYRYTTVPMPVNGSVVKPDSLQRRLVEASRASSKPPPPGSTASSADGYESFENTSNKKKRKIPLSGASSMHQSQLSAEMANMGISSPQDEGIVGETAANGVSHHQHHNQNAHATPTGAGSGTGISGAGRGRYGRQDGKHRRPLGSSTMNTINGYSRAPFRSGDVKIGQDPGIENSGGIISQAIKTAAEQGPLTPTGKGRENVSLLHSATTANNSATPKTQFTFTCESDSATKMVDQPAHQYPPLTPTPARNASLPAKNGQGNQTVASSRGNPPPANIARPPPPPANTLPPAQQQPPPPKPKPRRNPSKEYEFQASQRKKSQQFQNYHQRPKHGDMWICEFCEYEDIYGAPPYAMIRRYEIKDRQERKKAAEKRRLLEKAKMKGRKNKKGAGKGKNNSGNNATAPPAQAHPQNYDPNLPPPGSDEYYDDEDYAEDDYEPLGPDDQYPQDYYPPPVPVGTPVHSAAGGGARPHV